MISVFVVSIFALSGMLFGQRLIDLDKVWGDMRVLGIYINPHQLGKAVAHGDINGDGYMDIILGDPEARPGGRYYTGEVCVIFGRSNPPSTIDLSIQSADITVWGATSGDNTGRAVASGDINGDGYDDIIIGAFEADPIGRDTAGETYVIFGKSFSSPPYTIDLGARPADITIYGEDENDYFGYAVASGDLNGDGFDDLIISTPFADFNAEETICAGRVYVIFGSSFLSPPYTIDLHTQLADITICGADAYDLLGGGISSGDVNNDGYEDIIIGAPCADPDGRGCAGETYIIFGSSFASPPYIIDLNTQSADITIYGDDENDWSGWAVASGDVNNDGYDDVIIGAPQADSGDRYWVGETYVIFGDSFSSPPYTIDLSTQSADITVYGDDYFGKSGRAVTSGDVNGDGCGDLVIGASWAGESDAGKIYVIFGSSSPPSTIDLYYQSTDITIFGDDTFDYSGSSLASGDINGDGYDDVIIGDLWGWGYPREVRRNPGRTYVIFGGKSIPVDVVAGQGGAGAASYVRDFNGLKGNIWNTLKAFGPGNVNGEVSVAKGDVTGDGILDIVVGQRSMGASSYVRVFTQDGALLWTFKAFGAENTNGMVNVAVGDVDADGVGEIIVGQGPGGQSYVGIFEYKNRIAVTTWRAFGGGNLSGEVRVAAGQTAGSYWPVGQIITGQGHGGQSYIRVWDFGTPPTLYNTFRAFGGTNTSGGVDVGVGCFDAHRSGRDLIVVGQGGPGETEAAAAGSFIRVFTENGTLLKTIKAFGPGNLNGRVTVSGGQADDDEADEIIVGQAIGGRSYWRAFNLDGSLVITVKAFGSNNISGQVDVAGARKMEPGGGKSEQR